jgi:tetratricopeptide (TPR) repeat protein
MLRFCGAAMSAAVLLATTGCQDNFERAEAYAQQSRALYDAGDREGAFDAIKRAIALRDDNAGYFILLGAIQLRMNRPVDAYKAFSQALELDEANIEALSYVANLGLQVGRVDDASGAADRLLSLNPNSVVGLQVKGLAEMFRNRDANAQQLAERILKISPNDEAGTIIHARLLAKQLKFGEALEFLDAVQGRARPSAGILITRINLYRALRRPEDMARTYAQFFQIVPNATTALRLDQINLLYKLGRKDEARKAVTAFLSAGQIDLVDYQTLLRIWFEFDDQPYTRETLKPAKDWPDPAAVLTVGRYMLWQNHPQLADDVFFSVRPGIRPAAEGMHRRAAAVLNTLSDMRGRTDELLDRDGEDVDGLILYAHYKQQDGNLSLAIESMQKAVEVDPFNPEAYAVLANLREASGARDLAGQVFEDGLKRLPQDFMLIDRYLQFLHKTGDKNRAVSASRTFARALPSSVKAWSIFEAQCRWAGDSACMAEAAAGRGNALTIFMVDDRPGTPPDRGLLSKFQIQGV